MIKSVNRLGAVGGGMSSADVPPVLFLLVAAVLFLAGATGATGGVPILSVTSPESDQIRLELGLNDLDALPNETLQTTTPWTDGPHSFTGPSLSAVLEAAGAKGDTVHLVALNGYSVDIPMRDLTATVPILATRIDGKTLTLRGNGPIWLVYPYDSAAEFRTEVIFSRSIWHLAAIVMQKD